MEKIEIIVTIMTILPLVMLIWATPVYAKEYADLQKYVTCDLFNCTLEADINELNLTHEAKVYLKNVDKNGLTTALSELPEGITGIDYYIKDKEKLIVKVNITGASNNYIFWDFPNFLLNEWYNSSYPFCRQIAVEDGVANYRAFYNMTYSSNMTNTAFDGLLFINATCNETGSVLSHFKRDVETSAWATFDILLDGTQNISVYYGNSSDTVNHSSLSAVWYDPLLYTPNDENILVTLNDRSYWAGHSHGTIDGAEWVTGYHGFASNYNRGDTDFTSFGDTNDVTTGLTLLAWVYPVAYTGTNEYHIISKTTSGAVGSWVFGLYGNGSLRFDIRQAGGFCGAIYGGTPVPLEEWSLVGATYNSDGSMYVYLDGNIDGSGSCSAGNVADSSSTLFYGALASTTHNFDGYIDEAKLWNTTLNYTVMGWLFTDPEPTLSDGLELEFNASEPSNETVIDLTNQSYKICTSNMTLFTHDTQYINGTFNYTDEYYYCNYGCDNVTFNCYPEPFIQDFLTFIIFTGIIITVIWVFKRK